MNSFLCFFFVSKFQDLQGQKPRFYNMRVTTEQSISSKSYVSRKLTSLTDNTIETSLNPQSYSMWTKKDLLIRIDNEHFVVSNACDDRGVLKSVHKFNEYVICCITGEFGFTLDPQYFRIVSVNTLDNNVYFYDIDIKSKTVVDYGFDEFNQSNMTIIATEKFYDTVYCDTFTLSFDSEKVSTHEDNDDRYHDNFTFLSTSKEPIQGK